MRSRVIGIAYKALGAFCLRGAAANRCGIGHHVLHFRPGAVARFHGEESGLRQFDTHLIGVMGRNTGRAEFLQQPDPAQRFAGRSGPLKLLVLGGSLGAEPLNKLLPAALEKIPADLRPQVFHQAGKQHAEITAERYRDAAVEAEVAPFIKDMARAYGWADLVVCRAGALTVSELAAAGLPSFLVPLPHAIDDHQSRNAEYLAKEGAAVLLAQHATDADTLAAQLTEVLMHLEKLNVMGATARRLAKPDATRTVVDICQEVMRG